MKNTMTISETDKAYFRRLNRNLVFGELIRYFRRMAKEGGLTQKHLVDLLDIDAGRLSRLLSEPSNLTMDTVSDLLLGMNAQMSFEVSPIAEATTQDEFMEEFMSWSRGNNSLSAPNILEFVDRSPNTVTMSNSATNAQGLNDSFGDSYGQQAVN